MVGTLRLDRVHRHAALGFGVAAVCVYAVALGVAGRLPTLGQANAVALGATVDMVVVIPLAFYYLFVRSRALPALTLAPVFVLSVLAASLVLPAGHRQSLRFAEVLAVPIELGLLGWIAWRSARAMRVARRDGASDLLERLQRAAFELTRNDWAAAVLALELGVFYYAFASWRARPHAPAGTRVFSLHERSGHAGVVLAFLLLMAAEGFAVHVLLLKWSSLVAWIFTLSTVYAALWLLADYRATVLRPIVVDDECVLIRAGFRCTLRVPRAAIVKVGRDRPAFGKLNLNLTLLATPTHWITLSEPMLARVPYGFSRRVRALGLEPDDPVGLERALATPTAPASGPVGTPNTDAR